MVSTSPRNQGFLLWVSLYLTHLSTKVLLLPFLINVCVCRELVLTWAFFENMDMKD
ncbi:hypothetical protein ACJIZ3_020025 [Penstemon smallii]|uniref:Uncharacterized protein n=1 Tax=Penstemon smallii TaxID=265156 RepID=A0ABD3SHW7_9LAMI